ncbi:MAG: flagellar export chaperone FliS [Candidatus Sulfotelmatobacter sp.]
MDAKSSYREAVVRGASPMRLVLCLYEQAIEDLRRAAAAMADGNIETRTRLINHAHMVIGQLQGTLDMERGGMVARNLERFYVLLRAGLLDAQGKQSRNILEQQISQLTTVYEAWQEVERRTLPSAVQSAEPTQASPMFPSPETPFTEWNA